MYTITLTHDERRAIEFVGNRYRHGDELYRVLWTKNNSPASPEDVEWNDKVDITFTLTESLAWELCDIVEGGNSPLELFSAELKTKLYRFTECVV